MKIKFNKERWKKIGMVIAFLLVLPFFPEIALLADVIGIELSLTFLLVWLRSNWQLLVLFIEKAKAEIIEVCMIFSHAYFFRPKVYFSHASVSMLVIVISGSAIFSTVIWLPVIVMSSGALGPIA